MLKSSMQCAGIDQIRKGKLADASQPLENRAIDDISLGSVEPDKIKTGSLISLVSLISTF